MSRFTSSLLNVAFFSDQQFIVPAYQRPYVWKEPQIKKMLLDFWDSFKRDPCGTYYLGTIVTSREYEEEELIDGQQRFTTLWLIALAFKRHSIKSTLSAFLTVKNKVRLKFEIRTEVETYLQNLADDPTRAGAFMLSPEQLDKQPFLLGIARAGEIIFKELTQYFEETDNGKDELKNFAEYIAARVMFVKNTAPAGTDLKKLFTILNNSGIQLEQSDILKSRLLEKIKTQKMVYSKIWESCENMDNYFEYNVSSCFKFSGELVPGHFAGYNQELFYLTSSDNDDNEESNKVSLSDILSASDEEIDINPVRTSEGREVVCESVVTFPQLLLHTLRIFLQYEQEEDFKPPFHSSNLLDAFEAVSASGEEKIKRFFELLWKVRYLFDKYVVKWVEKNGEQILGKRPVTSKLTRGPVQEKNALTMLQSLLYFTGNYNTQMWLSPYLKSLLEGETRTSDLERIDNYLSLSELTDRQATWNLMSDIPEGVKKKYSEYLKGSLGTHFKHYWFYKLEYILWKTWPGSEDKQFTDYRITSKNSVEHICSQKDEFGRKLYNEKGDFLLHTFGNLTLLSVGQNSSYGNQDTGKKYIDHLKKPTYDSLKLARFFQRCKENVTAENVEFHQAEMLALIDEHYENHLLSGLDADAIELIDGEEAEY